MKKVDINNISFITRKRLPHFHSIEEIFKPICEKVKGRWVEMPYFSSSVKNIILNSIYIYKNQNSINHIIGDVQYAGICLKKTNFNIMTIHDCRMINTYSKLSIKRIILWLFWYYLPLKNIDIVTVVSKQTKDELLKLLKINPEKIIIIPNFVNENLLRQKDQKNNNNEKFTILQVGHGDNKNRFRLFEAVKFMNIKLLILGLLTEDDINILEKYSIEYTSYFNLSNSELQDLYLSADSLYFASTYEGFGVPIIEAQALGIPVITSNIDPMSQIAGKGAVKVNPYSIFEIREAIKLLIMDKSYIMNITNLGYENVKKYSFKNIFNEYNKLYIESGK